VSEPRARIEIPRSPLLQWRLQTSRRTACGSLSGDSLQSQKSAAGIATGQKGSPCPDLLLQVSQLHGCLCASPLIRNTTVPSIVAKIGKTVYPVCAIRRKALKSFGACSRVAQSELSRVQKYASICTMVQVAEQMGVLIAPSHCDFHFVNKLQCVRFCVGLPKDLPSKNRNMADSTCALAAKTRHDDIRSRPQ